MPDGDQMPNLLKYYLGLSGKVPAPRGRIPSGNIFDSGSNRFLTLSYQRDKSVNDIDCIGEVSPDYQLWDFGSGYTEEQRVDLGPLEEVTVRDLTPLASADKRFMRLRLQRR